MTREDRTAAMKALMVLTGAIGLSVLAAIVIGKYLGSLPTYDQRHPNFPGQRLAFSKSACVYLYVREEDWEYGPPAGGAVEGKKSISYKAISEDEATGVVLRGAECVVPPGMEVTDLRIAAHTEIFAIANWKDADAEGPFVTQYSGTHRASGIRVSVVGILKIQETCPEGAYRVYIRLPGLAALAKATSSEPRLPYDYLAADGSTRVGSGHELGKSADCHTLLLTKGHVSKGKVGQDGGK